MNPERISLKPSPLISTLSYLYTKFSNIQASKIDSILIQYKFDSDLVEQYFDQAIRQDTQRATEAQTMDDWYVAIDPHVGVSNPCRQMKVSRFDPDDSRDA